jgi:threonine synthase
MTMPAVAPAFVLRCIQCGASTEDPQANFRCAQCGDLLEVAYPWASGAAPHFDAAAIKQLWSERRLSPEAADQSGVWRFRELLPIITNAADAVTLREGNTPLYELPKSARYAGLDRLLAKHQGMNPTGSFKDTGMTAALSVAREKGIRWVACASTGNTSASMAAYAARAGINSLVLVPEGQIAWGKLAQAVDYGANTFQLRTDFDGCVRVLAEVMRRFPLCLLNSVNPFRVEGQKTAAIELLEQLQWQVPDHVVVPGGNLANSSALGKAFVELHALGMIARLPRISLIQAVGANPLVRSWRQNRGTSLQPVEAVTRATAIRIGNPASWKKAVAVVQASDGTCEDVTEDEIAYAKATIGADGIGCEPASAATLAGTLKLVRSGLIRAGETVVLVLTGHLLKDPDYTLEFHRQPAGAAEPAGLRRPPRRVDADADAVIRELERSSERAGN